jgi:cytochrome P450
MHLIARQTVVSTSAWAIHCNKEIFGEDVETFRPERWIEEKTGGMCMTTT